MNLSEIEIKIRKMFDEGKTDEEMSSAISLPVTQISMLRRMIGLSFKEVSPFSKPKKLIFDEYKQAFKISKTLIPHNFSSQIGLKKSSRYKFYMQVVGKEIVIKFEEQDE